MNDIVKISDDLHLYTGDSITLRADDGTFLKRFSSLDGHDAILSYKKRSDEFSRFTVEVLGSDKIRLIADNGNYLKRYDGWRGMSFISMDSPSPDAFSTFTIRPKGDSKVTLQAENGQYLKRYESYEGKSVITAYLSQEDPFSVFEVGRDGINAKEVITDIDFDMDKLKQTKSPFSVGTQTLTNKTDTAQALSFTVSKTVTTEKRFNWDASLMIGMTTEFSAEVPELGGGKVTRSLQIGFSAGGSKSNSDSQTFQATFPVHCKPHEVVQAKAIVTLGKVDVPYEATVTRYLPEGKTPYVYRVKGVYNGTNAFDLTSVLDNVHK